MHRYRLLKQMNEEKIIVNLCNQSKQDAYAMTEALQSAGLHLVTVDRQDQKGESVLKNLSQAFPQMSFGAKRCMDVFMIERALHAGASFVMTSHFDPMMSSLCHARGILRIPSVQSISEAILSFEAGLHRVSHVPKDVHDLQKIQASFPSLKTIVKSKLGVDHLKHWLESGAFAIEIAEHEDLFIDQDSSQANAQRMLPIVKKRREKNEA